MRNFRRIIILLVFFALAGGVWAAVYGKRKGFYETWRNLVEDEFAKRGFYTRIDKVTLGPLQGLVAEDVFFYETAERRRKIASVDNVILDLDLTEILNRDLSINTLDVQDAKLWLPLGKKETETLEIEGFSGRLVVTESQIEIVKARADLKGIEITLKGSLHRPPLEDGTPSGETELDNTDQQRQLEDMLRKIGAMVLDEIDRMEFDPFELPRLELEFSGDLADLGGMRASARLSAEDFERDSYPVRKLSASMEFDGEKGRATLKELHLRDSQGDLRLRADWPVGGNEITFDLDSNADIKGLVTSIYEDPRLGEVVFFDPPRLKMEGTIKLDELEGAEFPWIPIDAIGQFGCDRIGSRGTVFDGLEFNFSLSGDRSYVRNLRLDHRSGTLLANLMFDPALGSEAFRYQSEMKMDPKAFIPFVNSADARRFLSLWEFNRNASIYVAAMGSGPDLNPDNWHSRGLVDLRRLRLNNVRFNRLESDFEFTGTTQTYRNVRLARPDGFLAVPEASYHSDTGMWDVTDLKWSMDLAEGARAFSTDLSKELSRHQFASRPEMKINGTIDTRKNRELDGRAREHDFHLNFESLEPLDYRFLGKSFSLQHPRGNVAVKGEKFNLTDFAAGLFGGQVEAEFKITGGEKQTGRVTIQNADVFTIPPFRSLAPLIREAIPGADVKLSEAREMTASLNFEGGKFLADKLEVNAGSLRLTASGQIDSIEKTVQLDARVSSDDGESFQFKGSGPFAKPDWREEDATP